MRLDIMYRLAKKLTVCCVILFGPIISQFVSLANNYHNKISYPYAILMIM